MSLAQAKQAARRKQKEFDVKPIGGYTLKDAFVLWCNLKRGRIVSYKDEKKRIEFYLMRHLGNRQLDEITAPLVIKTVQVIERDGKRREVETPNIVGTADWGSGTANQGQASGALQVFFSGTSFCQYGEPGQGDVHIDLNASSGNAIYEGSAVQPKALNALPCIRC